MAAKEHGGHVGGGGVWVEMECPRVGGEVARRGNHPQVNKKHFPPYYFLFYLAKLG
jgi:hypothetical protein